MNNANDIWAAARQLGEAIAAERAARREALRVARNARRRARRAARPKPPPKPKTPVVTAHDDYDYEDECRCHVVRMPPCSWCENGGLAE
jgi:hypothetical protein